MEYFEIAKFWFLDQNPMLQALLATTFTWFLTAAGASLVFFFKDMNRQLFDGMLGFTGGVMIAASYWSLLAPAIEITPESNPGVQSGFLLQLVSSVVHFSYSR